MSEEFNFPFDAIMDEIRERCVAWAMAGADAAPIIIKSKASFEKLDVDGNTMPDKKPRPPHNPTNHPDVLLYDTGDMFDKSRWVSIPTETGAICRYSPPDHYLYVIPTRAWVTSDKINEGAAQDIAETVWEAANGTVFRRSDPFEGI